MNSSDLPPPVPVAIIGMGCMFPQAEDIARYWANIRKGMDAITEVPESHWRVSDYFDKDPRAADRTYAHRGGFLTPVDFPLLDFGIAPNSVEATDTTQLLGLMVARAALADAGYLANPALDRDKVSVILGVTGTLELVIPLGARLGHPIWRAALEAAGVDKATTEDVVRRIADSYVGWQENSFPGLLGNVAAGRIANRLDLGGTNCVVDAACASSLGAINLAMLELAAGRCDLAVTGGLDTFNDIFMYMCFSKTPALSHSGDARPFDADADGTILGEGLGVVVLKRLDDAQRDGDKIYAVIRSMGTSSDGKGQAVYAPSSAGQVKALKQAYRLAGISPATVGLVEAHGTGTKVGDAIELTALEAVYTEESRAGEPWCALGSVKSQVGHTKAAAGAAGLIKAALALYHKVLPPTSKVRRPIESLKGGGSPFYLSELERPWLPRVDHPRRAAVSAFGFGGSNFHCVLEEADPTKPGVDWDGDVQILAFSADSRADVAASLQTLKGLRDWTQVRALGARSRARFETGHLFRLIVVATRGKDDLDQVVASAQARLESMSAQAPRPRGSAAIFVGTGPAQGPLAMLFPGQGSQYVGMLRELACQFPRMQQALALVNETCVDAGETTLLSDRIYARTAYDDATRNDQDRTLRDTRFAQPAIGAVSLGLLRILADFGVQPALTGGHSFGELTALCAGGRIDDRSLAQLAKKRGEIMANCAHEGGGGAMLAVFAAQEEVDALLGAHAVDVVIANKNSPRQCVLSGPSGEIERVQRLFEERGVSTRAVTVSAAFHSRAVAAAEGPLREALDAIDLDPTPIPVFANATAQPYPEDPGAARALLASQLARPVEFVAQVEAMYRMGARAFLEVGPDAKLTGLVHSILDGRDHVALAVDATRGAQGNLYDLACSLATLASLGYAVDLTRWDDASHVLAAAPEKAGLTVKICGANARAKAPPKDSPPVERQPARPTSNGQSKHEASPPSPRFSIARTENGTVHSHRPAPDHTETDWTMNSPTRTSSHHTNGQASAHDHPGRDGQIEPTVSASAGAVPDVIRTPDPTLTLALRDAQDNLVALQRMAEQTAALHRQFLEGQEKTQQTFLELLVQEQRVSRTIFDPTAMPAPVSARTVVTERHDPPSRAIESVTPPRSPLSTTEPHRNGNGHVPTAKVDAPESVRAVPRAVPEHHARTGPNAAEVLLEVVAEKTGYPAAVLDLDMQLDADLGIDSIKRVEILSAIQDRIPGLPAIEPDALGSFRTLRAIIDFVDQKQPVAPRTGAAPVAAEPVNPPDGGADIARLLVDVVAEKTGYPAEMLELDMRLDVDLGIDSIKRVEIFSAIQDRLPEVRHAGPEQIGSLGTLREIVAFLGSSVPDVALKSSDADNAQAPANSPREALAKVLLESVADKTGYPIDMLELDMQLDTDLGIDSIKRVEILSAVQERLPDVGSVSPEQLGSLATLRQIVEALSGPPAPAPAPVSPGQNGHAPRIENASGTAGASEHVLTVLNPTIRTVDARESRDEVLLRAGGTVWVTADGSPLTEAICAVLKRRGHVARVIALDGTTAPVADDRLCALIIVAPLAPTDASFVKQAFRLLRDAGPALVHSATVGGAALLTVSRLEGTFGLTGLAANSSPATGALAGMAKTAGQEWRGVHCKAVDVASGFKSAGQTAELIVNELFERGPAEVGLSPEGRAGIELMPAQAGGAADRRPARLERGDLVVISGGARGVTAEVAVAMAEAFGPRLVVLGRTPLPAAEPDWLASLHDDGQLKRAILERSSGRRSLQEVGAEVAILMAQREVRRQLARIESAGSPVAYRSVDVRDHAAVRTVMAEIRREHGPVRGLVHGAGVLADRKIIDQTDSQFDLVYDTKMMGLDNIYQALDREALRVLILFSSSTARFGRSGQVAYAAANEVMNKWAQQQSVHLPECHVVSYNWGPWAGGMVNGSLKTIFEKEGLSLIPLDAGARLVVDQMRDGSASVEVVVLAEPAAMNRSSAPAANDVKLETVFRRSVDVDSMPVLASHVIDGHAVLPMAIILEWLAEGAVHRNPGLVVSGIDQLQLHKGVIVGKSHEAPVEIRVGKAVRDGDRFVVAAELRGTLPGGREIAHARASVILADRHESAPSVRTGGEPLGYSRSRDELYQTILFHGPAMRAIERIEGLDERFVAGRAATAPAPSDWLDQPLRNVWLTDPLAIDAAFQLMVVWCRERRGANSLPTAIGGYRQFRRAFPAEGVRIVAQIREASDTRAVADIEFLDATGALVARMDGYECAIGLSLNQAFRRNQLVPALALSRAD